MVRILSFHCRGPGSIPGRGTEIPQAKQRGQKKKKKSKSGSHYKTGYSYKEDILRLLVYLLHTRHLLTLVIRICLLINIKFFKNKKGVKYFKEKK